MRYRLWSLLLSFVVFAWTLEAQKEPKRPRLVASADTNEARSYLEHGIKVFASDPAGAADAFYWAARLDPMTAGEAQYGLAISTVMRSKSLLTSYMRGGRRSMPGKDLRRIDSLLFRAHVIDPFLFRRLDRQMLVGYIRQNMEQSLRSSGEQVSPLELEMYIEQYLSSAGHEMRGWMEYSDSRFSAALKLYAEAMRGEKFKAGLRIERGRIFGRLAEADSAIAEFQAALKEMRAREDKELVVLYNSKAVIEHSIAVLLEQKGDQAGAREAYSRALQEDLSYFPAHMRLGLLATGARDSTTAVSELDLAVQVAPGEPTPRFMLASALIALRQYDRAMEQLQKVIEFEPYWATPYAWIAQLHEQKSDGPKALESYNAYFARASRNHPLLPQMKARLANLKETMGISP